MMPDDMHAPPDRLAGDYETHAEGHQSGRRRPHRRPRRLGLIGGIVLVLAIATAIWGIYSREESEAALTDWTQKQAIPTVAVAHPTQNTEAQKLVLPGDVQAFYEAPIYARVSGYLASWSEDIGAHVRRGQTLGVIDTPDLDQEMAQAEADLATAQARQNFADLTAKRWHALLASNSVSQQSADEKEGDALAVRAEVNAQRAHVDRLRALENFKRLAAPFDGIVTARNTDIGALINAGSNTAAPLFKVADMHEMRIYVRVPQSYAAELKPGLHASLTEPQYPGRTFDATLDTTSVSVALESRTVLVELLAPNPDGKLWPGTFADVTFDLPGDAHVLRVPASALIFRSNGAQLATVGSDNSIAMKDVTIGKNLGTEIEIESGITQADRVVTSPLDTIENGEQVAVATQAQQQAAAE
jgi:RND family efflux transporter MFP subunit